MALAGINAIFTHRMNVLSKRIFAVALVGCAVLLVVWILFHHPSSYRFNHPLMTGLTKEEVIRRVGKPNIVPNEGGGDVWIYQTGMDPDATVTFKAGRVSEVWTASPDK